MSKTILLADDSVTIQKVVELTFIEEDVEVVAVGSGEAALERWAELSPDLVIADVHMPGPDGYEVCRRIKAERPSVPVLLLVGTFEPFNPEDVESCGAQAHLKKPFDSQELLRCVERLLGEEGGDEVGAAAAAAERQWEDPHKKAAATEAPERPAAPAEAAAPPAAAEEAPPAPPEEPAAEASMSDEDVERVARRVAELLGEGSVREVAWEVVPDLAEVIIRERLRDLEDQVE